MAKAGDVLEIPTLQMRIVFRQTTEDTGGELLEYDVIGRPRGFVAQGHVHPNQEERQEVVSGEAGISMGGRKVVLGPGESFTIPVGTPHRHFAAGTGEAQVRFGLRPALATEAFLERLAELDSGGEIVYKGFLKPTAAARVMREFSREGHATQPPLPVQRAFAGAALGLASFRENQGREYVFVDEWDVRAPIESVFNALADGTTYPDWWRPTYISVVAEGPLGPGQVSQQHFKGKLPYHLHTTSRIARFEPPRVVSAEVEGDLRGTGVWTLTEVADERVHVRFDWTVHADRALLRTLTPVLRPVFRWNHNWAITRAMEGLEPYVRREARRDAVAGNGAAAGSGETTPG